MTNELKVIHEQPVLGNEFKIYGDNENPLFLAKDVAEWIEHSKVSMMLEAVEHDEKLKETILTSGQKREMWFLTEDGLYEVLMQSRKPIAKSFKKEVKHILKTIRKTGSYNVQPKLPTTYKEALLALVEEVEKNEALTNDNLILTQQVTEYKPKVEYVDTILNNPSLLNITQIAKDYGMSGAAMNTLLSSLKVQYKSSGQWLLYSNHQSFGYTQSDTTSYVDKGITKTKLRTKWTQKGRLFIYELLKKNGILPLIEK